MEKRVNSPKATENAQQLTVGFCTNKEQEAQLQAVGVDRIWLIGRGLEELNWALDWLRGRAGRLIVASDFRIFGATRKAIMETLRDCELAGVTSVIDITHPEDQTWAQRVKRALVCIANARFIGDRRKARRCGAKGGAAKGVSAWRTRNEIAPRWLIENMVRMFGAVKAAAALDNKISASTLRRQYAVQA